MHFRVTASDPADLLATDLPATQPASSRLLQLEAGTLLANTPVGVYRHQLRAVREKLRLEVARSDQYCADAQLAKDQLKAEMEARNSIQVDRVVVSVIQVETREGYSLSHTGGD